MPVFARRATSKGCSCAQGAHQDAQKFTTDTWPCPRSAPLKPATGLAPSANPSNAGRAICGAGLPIRADGKREGSPLFRASAKMTVMAAKMPSGHSSVWGRPSRALRPIGGESCILTFISGGRGMGAATHATCLQIIEETLLAAPIEDEPQRKQGQDAG